MTYQLYEKNGEWYKSYSEVNGKPDKVVYLEHSDSMYPNEDKIMPTSESLIKEAKAGYFYTGMYGYKEAEPVIETKNDFDYFGGVYYGR